MQLPVLSLGCSEWFDLEVQLSGKGYIWVNTIQKIVIVLTGSSMGSNFDSAEITHSPSPLLARMEVNKWLPASEEPIWWSESSQQLTRNLLNIPVLISLVWGIVWMPESTGDRDRHLVWTGEDVLLSGIWGGGKSSIVIGKESLDGCALDKLIDTLGSL